VVSRREERIATGTAGAAMVAGGAHVRHLGVEHSHTLVGKPEPHVGPLKFKGMQVLRVPKGPGRGKARALFAAGSVLGLAGTAPLGAAMTNRLPARHRVDKKDSANTFVGSGLQGTRDALKQRAKTAHGQTSPKAYAAATGVGLGAGALGSQAAHLAFNRHDAARHAAHLAPSKLRHGGVGLAGTLALTASLPVANKVLHHVSPGYTATPYGVKRAKTAPVKPSTKAAIYEGRASRGADARTFRHQVVGKALDRDAQVKQYRARRRKLTTDAATTGLGLAGVGLLAAKHVPTFAATHPNLERHAIGTAIASGGVGALGGVQGIRIQRRDLEAQRKQLRVSKMGERLGARIVSTALTAGSKADPGVQLAKNPGRVARLIRTGRTHAAAAATRVALDPSTMANPLLEMAKSDLKMPYFPPKHVGPVPIENVAKAMWGPRLPAGALRAPAPRPSYLQTRRYAGGILKPTRVRASMG
jgi:hypothetical protein